jgi:hypothetical protein
MINGIYEAAKERGLVRSLRHFSKEFLHRAPNYLADTGFERCSAGALLNLYRRLGEIGQVDLQACAFERLLAAEDQSVGSALVRP